MSRNPLRTTYLKVRHVVETASVRRNIEQRPLNHCRQLHVQRRLDTLAGHSLQNRSTDATPHDDEPMETGSCDGNATESVNLPDWEQMDNPGLDRLFWVCSVHFEQHYHSYIIRGYRICEGPRTSGLSDTTALHV